MAMKGMILNLAGRPRACSLPREMSIAGQYSQSQEMRFEMVKSIVLINI